MSFFGNLLWIVIGGGLVIFAEYLIFAVQLAITVIGLAPFGKEVDGRAGAVSTVFNLVWMFTGGLVLALTHLVFAALCAVTVIGLPLAKQHMKLCGLALTPFGRSIV